MKNKEKKENKYVHAYKSYSSILINAIMCYNLKLCCFVFKNEKILNFMIWFNNFWQTQIQLYFGWYFGWKKGK